MIYCSESLTPDKVKEMLPGMDDFYKTVNNDKEALKTLTKLIT
jgi:hypothetical protein